MKKYACFAREKVHIRQALYRYNGTMCNSTRTIITNAYARVYATKLNVTDDRDDRYTSQHKRSVMHQENAARTSDKLKVSYVLFFIAHFVHTSMYIYYVCMCVYNSQIFYFYFLLFFFQFAFLTHARLPPTEEHLILTERTF